MLNHDHELNNARNEKRGISFVLSGLLMLFALILSSSAQAQLPVKIYIIAGQSNAIGDGHIVQGPRPRPQGTLQYIADNDPRGNYQFLRDGSGNWVERSDVWVANLGSGRPQTGNLRVNYIADVNNDRVGPELGMGHALGNHYQNPILLIKFGYGGATLYTHFRPPSSGPQGTPWLVGSNACTPATFSPSESLIGDCYREVIDQVANVTANLANYVPGYQPGQGYLISGFAWIQGLTDRGNVNAWEEYESNLVNFIADMRSDLGVPDLPFVMATPGMPCCSPNAEEYSPVEYAQMNVANADNNVHLVDMRGGYQGVWFNHPAEESPTDFGSWHYFQNGKTYTDMGLALGHQMIGRARPLYPSGSAPPSTPAIPVTGDSAFDNSAVPLSGNSYSQSFTVGWEFSTDREITIHQLGVRDDNGNGVLDGTQNVRVAIFNTLGNGGDILAQAVIPVNRQASSDGVVYSDPLRTELTLPAGTYVIGSLTEAGGEPYRQLPAGTVVNFAAGVTFIRELANPGTVFQHPDNWSASGPVGWFGPTFSLTSSVVIEPPADIVGTPSVDNSTIPNTGNVYDGNFTLGWEFSTDREITINQLGFRDENGDGLLNGSQPMRVAIFDTQANGGAILTDAMIPNNRQASTDGVVYSDVLASPLTLPAGTYVIGALTEVGGEQYRQLPAGTTGVSFADGVTFGRELANPGTTFQHPENWTGSGIAWFGPVFTFDSSAPPQPPPAIVGGPAFLNSTVPNAGEVFSFNFSLGWEFSTDREITITQFGYRDDNGDGVLNGTRDMRVAIWQTQAAGGAILTETTIPVNRQASADGVVYSDALASPLTLPAGTYVIGALTEEGGEPYRKMTATEGAGIEFAPGISFGRELANPGTTFQHPENWTADNTRGWFGPLFNFEGSSGPGQPPATIVGTPAIDNSTIPSTGNVYDGNFTLGWEFTTDREITINQLGMRDENGDGVLNGTRDMRVAIFQTQAAGGAVLVETTIPVNRRASTDGVVYSDTLTSPLTLPAGTYVIGALTETGGEPYRQLPAGTTGVSFTNGVTFGRELANPGTTFQHPENWTGGSLAWFGPNFTFSEGGGSGPGPNPGGTPAYDNATVPQTGNVYSQAFTLGWEFSTDREITISQLGFRDDNGDGVLNGTQAMRIAIFQTQAAGGAILAETTIPVNRAASADGVVYSDSLSSPLTIPAGTYVIGAQTEAGGEPYRQLPAGTAISFANGVTFVRELANPGTTFQHPENWTGGTMAWFGPSFIFSDGSGGPGPNPTGVPAYDNATVPLIGNVYDGNFTLGWEFSTDREITISQLGFRDDNGDGVLNGTQAMRIAIFETQAAGGAILAETTIPVNRAADADGVVYSDTLASPLTIPAGTYVIGALTETGGEPYRQLPAGTAINFADGVTFVRELANPGTTFQHPENWTGGTMAWFGPSFIFSDGSSGPGPNPTGVPAYDNATVPLTGNVYDGNFTLGWEFSTDREITISQLGFRDDNGDGVLNGTQAMRIAIFQTQAAGGAILAETTIPVNRAADADGVVYSDTLTSPLTIPAGTYVIGALTETGGEPYRQLPAGTAINFADGVTFVRELANPGTTFQHPENWTGGTMAWFGPSFIFSDGSSGPGPNPTGAPAYDNATVPLTGNVYSQAFTLGWEFSTDREITISQLGFRDDNGDGVLNGTQAMRIAIFETQAAGGAILAETTIPVNRAADADGVVYSDDLPTPLTIPAGTYVIGALTEAGGEPYRQLPAGTAISFTAGVTFVRELANPGTTFQHPENWTGGTMAWFGPNFIFTSGGGSGPIDPIDIPPTGGDGMPDGIIQSRAVYQRNFDGSPASLPLVVNNPSSLTLQYQVVNRDSGATGAWIGFDEISGGASRTRVSLSAGWYDIRVRNSADQSIYQTIERVGVGEVFVVAGQSNSHNYGEKNPAQIVSDKVSAYNLTTGEWVHARDPQINLDRPEWGGPDGYPEGVRGLKDASPWGYFGNMFSACFDLPVHIISVGWGGTSIAQWLPDASPISNSEHLPGGIVLYNERLRPAMQHVGQYNSVRAVLWHQGESDTGTSASVYRSRLQTIIQQSRDDISDNTVPWMVALASSFGGSLAAREEVIQGQVDTILGYPNVFVGSQTDKFDQHDTDFPGEPRLIRSDGIHFAIPGLEEHAKEWFNAIKRSGLIPDFPDTPTCGFKSPGYSIPSSSVGDADGDGFNDVLAANSGGNDDPPEISFGLAASNPTRLMVQQYSTYFDPIVNCTDSSGNNLPVIASGDIDADIIDETVRSYSCTDGLGKNSVRSLNVSVESPLDYFQLPDEDLRPILSITPVEYTVRVGEQLPATVPSVACYNDPNLSVVVNVDLIESGDDITDTSVANTFTRNYSCQDELGNSSSGTFTLVVEPDHEVQYRVSATDKKELGVIGAPLGDVTEFSCPDNMVLSDIITYSNSRFSSGNYPIRGVKFRCRELEPDGSWSEQVYTQESLGYPDHFGYPDPNDQFSINGALVENISCLTGRSEQTPFMGRMVGFWDDFDITGLQARCYPNLDVLQSGDPLQLYLSNFVGYETSTSTADLCGAEYAVTGAELSVGIDDPSITEPFVNHLKFICSKIERTEPNVNFSTLGELLAALPDELTQYIEISETITSFDDVLCAEDDDVPDEYDLIPCLADPSINNVSSPMVQVDTIPLEDESGTRIGEINKVVEFEQSFTITINGSDFAGELALVDDDQGSQQLLLTFSNNGLTWSNILPSTAGTSFGNASLPPVVMTWLLTGNQNSPAAIISNDKLTTDLRGLYDSAYGNQSSYTLNLYHGLNFVSKLSLNDLSPVLTDAFGGWQSGQEIILAGGLGFDSNQFTGGNWSVPSDIFLSATLQATSDLPDSLDSQSLGHLPASNLSQFGAFGLESVSLNFIGSAESVSVALIADMDMTIDGVAHNFELVGRTTVTGGASEYAFTARMVDAWAQPFGFTYLTIDEVGLNLLTDGALQSQVANFSGAASINGVGLTAAVNIQHVAGFSAVALELDVENLARADLESLLTTVSGEDWSGSLPAAFDGFQSIVLRQEIGSVSRFNAHVVGDFCLDSFVGNVSPSCVNELSMGLDLALSSDPSNRFDIAGFGTYTNGTTELDALIEDREVNGQNIFILRLAYENAGPGDEFTLAKLAEFTEADVTDLNALFALYTNSSGRSVRFGKGVLEINLSQTNKEVVALAEIFITHGTGAETQLDVMIDVVSDNGIKAFAAIHETEQARNYSDAERLALTDLFTDDLENHQSGESNNGIRLSDIRFTDLSVLLSTTTISETTLSPTAQQLFAEHFSGFSGQDIPQGLHFIAQLDFAQPSLAPFHARTSDFGTPSTGAFYVAGGITTSPEFDLRLTVGFDEFQNQKYYGCDGGLTTCLTGAPDWFASGDLDVFMELEPNHFLLGLEGALEFVTHEQAMRLVVEGDVDIEQGAMEFCAELETEHNPGSANKFATCPRDFTPVYDCALNGNTGSWVNLFGQNWLEFHSAGLHLTFSELEVAVDMNADMRLAGKEVDLREFGLAVNPETGLPIRFDIDIETGANAQGVSLDTNEIIAAINGMAGEAGLPSISTTGLPNIGIGPVTGQDCLALRIDAGVDEFPRFGAGGTLYINDDEMGHMQIDVDAHHAHFTGDVDFGSAGMVAARFDLDSTGLDMAAELDIPVVGGRIVEVLREGANCGISVLGNSQQCVNHVAASTATSAFECGYQGGADTVSCISHPRNNLRWGWFGPRCKNFRSCSVDIGIQGCQDNFDNAVQTCEVYRSIDSSMGLSIMAKAEVQIRNTNPVFSGNAEGDLCFADGTCYYVKSDVQITTNPLNFTMNIGDYGAVKETTPGQNRNLMAVETNYPFVYTDIGYRGNVIDMNADGRSELVSVQDQQRDSGSQFDDLLVSYSGRSEPRTLIAGDVLSSYESPPLNSSVLHYANLVGDRRTEILAEFIEETDSGSPAYRYRWLLKENDSDLWVNINPEMRIDESASPAVSGFQFSVPPADLVDPNAELDPTIKLILDDDAFGESTSYTLKRLLVADFDGDIQAEILMMGLMPSGGMRWYMCEVAATVCTIAYDGSSGDYNFDSFQIGYFNLDGKMDIFYAEEGVSDGEWTSFYSLGSTFSPSPLRTGTYADLLAIPEYANVINNDLTDYEADIARTLHLGDFNNDRITDVFVARTQDSAGRWIWQVSYSGTGPWEEMNKSWVPPDHLHLTDVDGDGYTDVLLQQDTDGDATDIDVNDLDGDGLTTDPIGSDYSWRVVYAGRGAPKTIEIDNSIHPDYVDVGAITPQHDLVTVSRVLQQAMVVDQTSQSIPGNVSQLPGWQSRSGKLSHDGLGSSWRVDLDRPMAVDEVWVHSSSEDCCDDRLRNFKVELLDSSGQLISSSVFSGTARKAEVFRFAAVGVSAVRVLLNEQDVSAIAEIEVFGVQ
ncbi:MAG: hypothetical protein Tsb002_33800 [Wenzhouxiangellaceae bacterium]